MEENNEFSDGSGKARFVRIALMITASLILVGFGGLGVGYIARAKPEWLGIKNASTEGNNQAEVESLIKEIGKLIQLPDGETPTVATVTDVEKVREQPFFKNALVGDKVLVYSQSKKAILYRPTEKKVIEVGFVNIGNEQAAITPAISPSISVTSTPTGKPTAANQPTVFPSPVITP